jgi:hypothetical protein
LATRSWGTSLRAQLDPTRCDTKYIAEATAMQAFDSMSDA